MAEKQKSEFSVVNRFLSNWNFKGFQAADEELFVDDGCELSDAMSLESSMDIDMDPFGSDKAVDPRFQYDFGDISARSLLPLELVEMIAVNIAHDADLISFILSCKDFAMATVLEKSTVWRRRFLARYDHPIIDCPYEFRVAYQLRELVLRKFPSFADGGGARGRVALEVLRDMVLETYHHLQISGCSKSLNLQILSNPASAPFMDDFLSSPVFACQIGTCGEENRLFAALQLVFSHLVLHPRSEFPEAVKASRENYDLSIVYLYSVPLKTINQPRAATVASLESWQWTMDVDLNALLHIRNFWHCQLASSLKGTYADTVVTYGEMARMLEAQHHTPKEWETPIQQLSNLSARWFGHYSCTHPAPRRIIDIERHQTCAEDWIHEFGERGVHPLTLEIATKSSLHCGWWPPIFSTIPIFESMTQSVSRETGWVCVRGIAPFLSPPEYPDMYPAYTALRIRGFIDPLPEQEQIPGWRRIVMVLYKPTSRYLLAVLEESSSDDEDDNPFGQINALAALTSTNTSLVQNSGQVQVFTQDLPQTQVQNHQPPQDQDQVQPQIMPVDPEAEEKVMKKELEARNELKGPLGPVYLTREAIGKMEDRLHPPEELTWEDVSYAYAYEGVVIPGGKIMMGRYWRFGAPNAAVGYELGEGADRGPWIFWS